MIKQLNDRVRRIFIQDSHPELPIDPDVTRPGRYKWPIGFRPILVLAVFVGGCIGTYARDWISSEFTSSDNSIPMAILIINILGAFILGLLLESLARIGKDHGALRIIRLGVGTGFCGGFTTYSTFVFGGITLINNGNHGLALIYISLSVVGGLITSAAGIQIAAIRYKSRGQA